MPFVADEIVTATKLNMATSIFAAEALAMDRNGFTNTTFADLDALTAGTGTGAAVAVTVTTGTVAQVTVSATVAAAAGVCLVSFRVSGATTIASAATSGIRNAATSLITCSITLPVTLTAGVNVFELQGSVTASTGRIIAPTLRVDTRT